MRTLARVTVILLFAISFALIGYIAPVVYASNMPQDQIIEVHNFEAQNASANADEHYICFDRTVHRPASAEMFTELYVLGDDGERMEVLSMTERSYLEEGKVEVVVPFDLPGDLREGNYRYLLVIKMELADGRVTRSFAYESDRFHLNDGPVVERPKSC